MKLNEQHIYVGFDPGVKLSLWEKIRLLFVRGNWSRDGDHAVFFRVLGDKYYIVDEMPKRTSQSRRVVQDD